MFKKPFKIKSNARLKSSDIKRLKLTIQKQFSNIPDESLSTLISNKDEVYTVKVVAHSGEIVYLYCVQKLPLLFEINETIYPTVYTLWNFPDLLPTFTTHPQVLNSLSGGADLMLPGVVIQGELSINSYGKLEKGARVSVNLTNNKAPIAVGKSALSSFDMYMSARRGKCVNILHCYDDCLFNYGTTLPKPELGLVYNESDFSNEMDNIQETVTNIQLNDEKQLETVNIQGQVDNYILEENVESIKEINENSDVNSDDLLMYCFLKSLRRNVKKDVLPILASTFYKQYVLAALPDGKQIDIKKTKYKKFSTFLTEVAETKIITLEMAIKGVQKISSIDFEHDLLKTFYHQYAALEEIAKNSNQTKSIDVSNTPKIQERHTVTSAVLPLFSLYLCKKGESLTIENIRKYITDYVNAKNLKDNENKKNVKLDQLLKGIVGGDKDTITWDMLFNLVLGRMGNSYELSVNEKKPAVIVKGKLQPIDMQVATRVGNKKVTLVSNLELYGINVTEFAHECQHGVGASTTINNVPGSKSSQVQIQGNQVIFVNKLLTEKYKIQKRFIRGLEFSPKNKKK